jgi:hypothetical protein
MFSLLERDEVCVKECHENDSDTNNGWWMRTTDMMKRHLSWLKVF